MDNDFIITHIPIDKEAALVMTKGYEYVPMQKYIRFNSESQPPKRKLKTVALKMLYNQWKGHKYAKMTVVGISKHSNKRHALWIVQCNCGLFELRSLKAIANPKNIFDRCMYCEQLARDKQKYDRRRGLIKNIEEY